MDGIISDTHQTLILQRWKPKPGRTRDAFGLSRIQNPLGTLGTAKNMRRIISILFITMIAFPGVSYAHDFPQVVVGKYLKAVRSNNYDEA